MSEDEIGRDVQGVLFLSILFGMLAIPWGGKAVSLAFGTVFVVMSSICIWCYTIDERNKRKGGEKTSGKADHRA